ncbi:myb-like protein X [Bicyclus anynana]|uniref:TIMELESS-interacting protein n=1 Tax=Bicyclus anynana TaxID=110368 RepID=A0A6J1NPL7_BICAN|nr:myb-like protein X [Bicyclus anynana]
MSLLEDVFLQDEANEAQELERVIEGDEFDERPRSRSDSDNNSEREDEAEEEKKRVDPTSTKTRRVIKNPRFILNPARLTGPRGIHVIPEHFKDFKFKGKGHEKEDLDLVLKKLEHWAYRLYPKFKFEDCLKKIETLGKKRPVMVNLHKIRTDQFMSEETVVQRDSSDDEDNAATKEVPPEDEFDKLLQQQIELARSTPAPDSVKKGMGTAVKENRSLMTPKAMSSPSISNEQRERIIKSRKLAEERRLARLKNASLNSNTTQRLDDIAESPSKADNTHEQLIDTSINYVNSENDNVKTPSNGDNISTQKHIDNNEIDSDNTKKVTIEESDKVTNGKVKKVRANIIDSSDEDDIVLMNESIRADVHKECDGEKNYTSGETQVPRKVYAQNNDDDDVILEIDENQENDILDVEDGTVSLNKGKDCENATVKNVTTGLKSNFDGIVDLDDNSNDPSIVRENGSLLITTTAEKNANDDEDVTINEKSSKEIIGGHTNSNENQNETRNDEVEKVLKDKVVENNVEELMDVDFDDDF